MAGKISFFALILITWRIVIIMMILDEIKALFLEVKPNDNNDGAL